MATIKDIAQLAGVSHGTVSNVLNGNGKVSSAKILAVQKAARELGYTIDINARQLRKGGSNLLAVVLPNLFDRQYADFYTSFENYAQTRGFRTALYISENNLQKELEQIRQIKQTAPYGIAAVTSYEGTQDIYAQTGLSGEEILYVEHCPNPACNSIGFDDYSCGRAFGEKARQYRCVALVTSASMRSSQQECIRGFREALADTPECYVQTFEKNSSIRAATVSMSIFSCYPQPEAVFVTNYGMAQSIRNVKECFFPERKVRIYTLSPIFTMPENDFVKYELNYRLLGKEAAQVLLEQVKTKQTGRHTTLSNYGFRCWSAPKVGHADSLTMLTLDSPTAHLMEDMSQLYRQSTGTQIHVSIFSYDSIHELLNNLDASNTFDMIRLDATWLNWFAKRIYEPFDQIDPDATALMSRMLPGIAAEYGMQDGTLYAVPETPSAQMLFYRQDLFEDNVYQRLYKERYKTELRPPENFREFNQIAGFFTRKLNPASPVAYGTTMTLGNTGVAATEFLTRYFSLTDTLFDDQDRILLQSPEAVQALELLTEDKQFAAPVYCNWWRDTAKLFAQGDVAMTILFSNYASEMLNRESRVHTKIGYAMVPGGNAVLGGGVIGVCRYSKHKKEAANFIRWLCSEEVSTAMTLLGSVSPCKQTYENYQVIDTYPWLSMTEECFATSHIQRCPRKMKGGYDQRQFLSILGLSVMQAINGTMDVRTALATAEANYHQFLAETGKKR